ncbi:MAG: hypothetical protein ACRC1D_00155 [Culicoidibacterales bacterium]
MSDVRFMGFKNTTQSDLIYPISPVSIFSKKNGFIGIFKTERSAFLAGGFTHVPFIFLGNKNYIIPCFDKIKFNNPIFRVPAKTERF